jgi:Zn-dependent peptidase ImmA (M78 family)/transcriptional regulator with XRE-family HTH domain
MVVSERIPLAPGILTWARLSSGYDVSLAAKRLTVSPERLQAWEAGETNPTVIQLRQMAKLYKRPLAVLLLPTPPKDFDALRDFRRTGEPGSHEWSPALHAEFKRALTQREVMLELAELAPASLSVSTKNFRIDRDVTAEDASQRLRALLGMEKWKGSTWSNPHTALRSAIEAIENLGILVLQTRDVSISEARGFSISEWPYPVIILNGSDWPRPRLFTLLHELCHLVLNSGGLCDLHEVRHRQAQQSVEDRVEHYCNQVAAGVLMPRARIMAEPMFKGKAQWTLEDLVEIGKRYSASTEALLLRLVNLNITTWDTYWEFKPQLEAAYAEARQREKDRQKSSDGGPTYYTIKARNLGHSYVQSVLDAFQSHAISSYDVVDYLDVKFGQLPKLQAAAQR